MGSGATHPLRPLIATVRIEALKRGLEVKQARVACEVHPDKELAALPPGEWSDLPANRHQRKRLKAAGSVILHLYAGKKEGFTLQKAMEEHDLGSRTLEVDLQRGEDHDMAAAESKASKLCSVWHWMVTLQPS